MLQSDNEDSYFEHKDTTSNKTIKDSNVAVAYNDAKEDEHKSNEMIVPFLLESTLMELVDCAQELSETFVSLQGNRNAGGEGNGSSERGSVRGSGTTDNMENIGHIFMIPEIKDSTENVKKYRDFANVGKTVLKRLREILNNKESHK